MQPIRTMVVIALAGSSVSAQTFDWNNASGGLWNAASNWSPAGVPDIGTEAARIGLAGTYTVTFDSNSIVIAGLEITNPSVTLDISNGRSFDTDVLNSNALIRVNPQQGASTSTLTVGDGLLAGGGMVQLFTRPDIESTSNGTLVSQASTLLVPAGVAVRGSGRITNSTTSGNTLLVQGEVRAQMGFGASALVIDRYGAIDMSGGGALIADGNDLRYSGAISNGTIRELNGGRLDFGSVTLNAVGVDLPSAYPIRNGTTTTAAQGTVFPAGVLINPEQGTGTTTFQLGDASTSLPDAVDLFTRADIFASTNAQLSTTERTLTIPAGAVVRGSGRITNSQVSGNTLAVDGEIRALPGFGAAPIDIQRYALIDLTGGGELIADGADILYTGSIIGGSIREINGGALDFGSITLDAVNIDQPGVFSVRNGTTTTAVGGTLFVNGVSVNPEQGTGTTTFLLGDASTSLPDAVDLFTRADIFASTNAQLSTTERTLTIPAGAVVRGSGRITNSQVSGNTLAVDGEIRALPGFGAAPIDIQRYALIDLTGGGELIADGADILATGTTIANGTVRAINGGQLAFGSLTLSNVDVVQPGSYDIENGSTLIIRGTTSLPGGVRINPEQGTGSTVFQLDDASATLPDSVELFTRDDIVTGTNAQLTTTQDTLVIPVTTTVQGSGNITNADLSNNTLINRGTLGAVPGNGLAPLTVLSRYTTFVQESSGRLEVFIDPDGTRTTIIQSSNVTLAGDLVATFAPGYVPQFGDTFELFPNAATGQFDSFQALDSNGNPFTTEFVPFVFYRNDGVFVSWTCVPDSNTDLLINILDVIDFINIWNSQSAGADFNEDGTVNILDVVSFINAWSAGCA